MKQKAEIMRLRKIETQTFKIMILKVQVMSY